MPEVKEIDHATAEKTCPRCKVTGDIGELFGWRDYKGAIYAQSQCMKCRGKKPVCREEAEQRWADKLKADAEDTGKAIMAAAEPPREPACKMIGYCCITMLGGIGDGLGCMYCRRPMDDDESPHNKLRAGAVGKAAEVKVKLKPQPKPKEKAAPKLKHIWISGDRGTLKIQYKQYFPNDTNNDKRAPKFMIQKLAKKLGDKANLTENAKMILEGK